MNNIVKIIFVFLVLCTFSCIIVFFYLFLFKDLKILSAVFLSIASITSYLSINIIQSNPKMLNFQQKRFVKNIIPPFLTLFISNKKNKSKRKEVLFNGAEDLFKEYIQKCSVYGEYGMGLSTIEAIKNKNLIVYAVDSDEVWVKNIKHYDKGCEHLLRYVDLGEVLQWGFPEDYSKKDSIKTYLNYIWDQEKSPDFVLIDGRFRVASFLTSIKRCNLGTTIIFDDYLKRKHYHVVAEIIQPTRFFGHQAVFEVNSKDQINTSKLDGLIYKFEYVMQ